MYILGSNHLEGARADRHLRTGLDLTAGCYEGYKSSPTGLTGEDMYAQGNKITSADTWYYQRPETIESIFYAWRKTHDPKYREWGWKIAQSIEEHTKQGSGYTALLHAFDKNSGTTVNVQDSFFLAETLKYLYLLFSDDDVIPIEQFVFNTEAHPVSIRGYGKREKNWVNIPSKEEEWTGGRRVGQVRN
jgi:mannosyl-oligosaccharide alpha-1,2-mannosidase